MTFVPPKMLKLAFSVILLSMLPGSRAAAQVRGPMAAGEHNFQSPDVRLWYRVAGTGGRVPIVFLHGGPGEGSQAFAAFGGPDLEKKHRIIYLDQRGAGRSERPKASSKYSMAIMVEDIENLRRHIRAEKLVLLGHSFGTQLALDYAVKYPARVEALVLAAASPHLLRSLDLQCERLSRMDPAAYGRAREGISDGALPRCDTRKAYSGDLATAFVEKNLFPDQRVARIVNQLDGSANLRNSGEAAGALFSQGLLQYRFDRAGEITAPVLIVAGGRDFQAALEPQVDIASQMPRSELLVYPRSGHFMFVEEPRKFARDVNHFLESVGTAR